jgi:hypothetical protein
MEKLFLASVAALSVLGASAAHAVEIQDPPDIYCKPLGPGLPGADDPPTYIRIHLEAGTVEWFKAETYRKGGQGKIHPLVGYDVVPEWNGQKNQIFMIKYGADLKYQQATWELMLPRNHEEWNPNGGKPADGLLNSLDIYGKHSKFTYACNLVR